MTDLDDRARSDKVSAACRWYRNNVAYIKAMLAEGEIKIPHEGNPHGFSLYPQNWDPSIWIERWENKDQRFTLDDAEVLISAQLRPLWPVVRDRMIGTNPGK